MSSFRQVAQGYVDAEIVLMELNPTKDLIALTTVTGKVLLYRHSWQQVWEGVQFILSQNTLEKTILPIALTWRPDGEVLASAFDNEQIILCDVDDGQLLHVVTKAWCKCVFLNWVQCIEKQDAQSSDFCSDTSAEYLQKYFPYSTKESSSRAIEELYKKIQKQKVLTILVSGLEDGTILLNAFGIYHLGSLYISLKPHDPIDCKVVSVTMFRDLRVLTVVVERKDKENNCDYIYRSYYLSAICDKLEEIQAASLKFSQISTLYISMSSSITKMAKCWENIQTEMDAKFRNYIQQKDDESHESIDAEFTNLLLLDIPSDALKRLLLHDLKEEDIEKFLSSIEASYLDLQNFVNDHLQLYGLAIFYHLNEVKGMATWKSLSSLLLEEVSIGSCMISVGSFLLKTAEIQQVVKNNIDNMKAFFRGLHVMMLRLSKKPIPNETLIAAQKDLPFMQKFMIDNFYTRLPAGEGSNVEFKLFDQYLKDEDLPYPISTSENLYAKFLEDHPSFKKTGFYFNYCSKKSLYSLSLDLRRVLSKSLNFRDELLVDSDLLYSFNLLSLHKNKSPPRISHFSCSDMSYTCVAFTDHLPPSSQFTLIHQSSTPEVVVINFSNSQDLSLPSTTVSDKNKNYQVMDVKFYDKCIMVLLLENRESETNCSIVLQLPLATVINEMVPLSPIPDEPVQKVRVLNGLQLMEKNPFTRLENIKASQMTVSASRKVISVFSVTQRKIQIFKEERKKDCEPF